MTDDRDALQRVIDDVVAPGAVEVDTTGKFPREAIAVLGNAGILGATASTDVGGGGQSLRGAADVIRRLAGVCGSTAMVILMHYAATAVIDAHGPDSIRRQIAEGTHLTTLAFSEVGSRSHFWAPGSTATAEGGAVRLDARKSWVTAAGEADSYVWSSRPLAADGPMTLWLVPASSPGLSPAGGASTASGCGATAPRPSPPTASPSRCRPCSAPTAPGWTSPWPRCCRGSWSSAPRSASG